MRDVDSAVARATLELEKEFDQRALPLLHKCGAVFHRSRHTNIYVSFIGTLMIEFFIDAAGAPSEIRMSLQGDGLLVGWSGNLLLCTKRSAHDDEQISTVVFVGEVFKHADEWIELIKGLNVQPLLDALAAEFEAKERVKEERRKANLLAFVKAGIKVGTELVDVSGNVLQVTRISSIKVQIGKSVYSKEFVGGKLLEGVWQVRN